MARYLSTTSDIMSQGTSPIPQIAGSLGFWVFPHWSQTDGVDHYFFAAQNAGPTKDFSLQKFSDNSLYYGWNTPGGTDSRVTVASAGYSLLANAWNHFLLAWDSSGSVLYLNGASIGTKAAPVTFDTTGNTRYWGYSAIAGGLQSNQAMAECAIWTAKLTDDEALALARGCLPRDIRPGSLDSYLPLWGLTSPEPDLSGNAKNATLSGTTQANHAPVTLFTRKARVEVEPAATNFTLDAQPATLQFSGKPATLLHDSKIDAAPATFNLSGATAAFLHDRVLPANPATFQLNGGNAGLLAGRVLDAGSASFVLSGRAADFLVGFLLNANPGTFQLDGFSATLKATRLLNAASGAFHLAGSAAGLIVGYQMDAAPAAFVLTGQAATLRVARVLNALAGGFTLDGVNAALLRGYTPLAALPGSYALAGQASGLRTRRLIPATPGSFLWTGNPAFFVYKPLVAVTIPLAISSSRLASFLVSSTIKQTFFLNRTVAVQTNLTCPSGQARVWTATFQTPTAIAGQNFAFTARDAVGNILFQLTTANGGITIADSVNGVLTIVATTTNTALPPQQGEWDVWRTDTGFEDQLGFGSFTVTPNFRNWNP